MDMITVKDGTKIYYKDWGTGQPIFFHHGWPLSADDWDAQMMFFLARGYRVIAHDRRGHGRSTQTANGNDMDTYAADVAELVKSLDLKNVIHIGHSTGGGELTRYVAKHGKGRVAKAVLISSVPPQLLKSDKNPDGLPMEVFDQLRDGTANHRSQFYQDITMPFYGFNRPGAKISQGIRDNWWRQAMMGGIKAQYDCVKALSETAFFEDLKSIDVPVLVMHGEDDQICPFLASGAKSVKLVKPGPLRLIPVSHMACPLRTQTRSMPISSNSSSERSVSQARENSRAAPGFGFEGWGCVRGVMPRSIPGEGVDQP
jgi:non-heme chloroperoxidase